MDAHSSFAYLVDVLPRWQVTVDRLTAYTIEKNTDFAAEYARLLDQARPKRKKSPSVSSIHTADEHNAVDDPGNAAQSFNSLPLSDSKHINPMEAGNRYLYAQARRKRKPGPSIRSGASGPQRFRNKIHVVVYYDGYLQEKLDTMVKQIGVCRNKLRKGKNDLAALTGFRLPALPRSAERGLLGPEDIGPAIRYRSTPALLPTKTQVTPITQPLSNEAGFVQADKELDQIQSLCETAAHQFLRDGDCKTELDNVRQKLDALLVHATSTAESLESLPKIQEAAHPDTSISECAHDSDSDITLSKKPSLDLLSTPKLGLINPSSFAFSHPLDSLKAQGFFNAPVIPARESSNELNPDLIEVDDGSDQGSIVVDLSHYRQQNPRRVRA